MNIPVGRPPANALTQLIGAWGLVDPSWPPNAHPPLLGLPPDYVFEPGGTGKGNGQRCRFELDADAIVAICPELDRADSRNPIYWAEGRLFVPSREQGALELRRWSKPPFGRGWQSLGRIPSPAGAPARLESESRAGDLGRSSVFRVIIPRASALESFALDLVPAAGAGPAAPGLEWTEMEPMSGSPRARRRPDGTRVISERVPLRAELEKGEYLLRLWVRRGRAAPAQVSAALRIEIL